MQIRYSCTESSHFARLISVRNSFSLQYQPLPVHLASADPPHAPLPASTNARSKQTPLTAAHPGGRRPKRAHRPSGSVLLRTDVAHICSKKPFLQHSERNYCKRARFRRLAAIPYPFIPGINSAWSYRQTQRWQPAVLSPNLNLNRPEMNRLDSQKVFLRSREIGWVATPISQLKGHFLCI